MYGCGHDENDIAPAQQGSRERSVARAIAYVEAHFREPLSLALIAAEAHVSKFHFARMFRRNVGLSPMQYVRWRRIVEARRLLHAGHAPTVVAGGLGYFDQSHFTRAFRAATGLTPHQYMVRSAPDGDAAPSVPAVPPTDQEHACLPPPTPPSITNA